MSDNKLIRYAVIGLGRSGWDIHVHQLRDRSDAKIVAAVDPEPARRAQAESELGCLTFDSLPAMLRDSDAEVIVIATPSANHMTETLQSLDAGRHVVVEKPMATSLADADAMIAAASAARRRLFIHQNYRFFPEFLHLKETIDSGRLGRIYHIRNYISHFARRNDWQTLRKHGGGVLNNTCIHFLDQLLQLLPGKVTEVFGDLQQIASAGDVEDHVKAVLRTDAGATADMEISSAQNIATQLPKWILCGTTGTLSSDGKQSIVRWFDPKAVAAMTAADGPAADRRYGNDEKLPWQEETITIAPRPADAFYNNVADVLLRDAPMIVTPQSVRETMRVVSMIRQAAAD